MNDTGIGRLPLIYNKIDKLLELKRLFFNAVKIKYLSSSQGEKCDIALCSDQEFYSESQKVNFRFNIQNINHQMLSSFKASGSSVTTFIHSIPAKTP